MAVELPPRERAYLDILERGVVMVRNLAFGGNIELCGIEADHLHNIPSLLFEPNERRHEYYIAIERTAYLQQLGRIGATGHLEEALVWYAEPWNTLALAAGVELSE